MTEPILFYASVLLTAFLGLVLAAVALSYRNLIKKYYSLRQELERQVSVAEKKADEITQKAVRESERIIGDAHSKARKILSEASVFTSEERTRLLEDLGKVREKEISAYQGMLEEVKRQTVDLVGRVSKDASRQLVDEVGQFRSSLQREILKVQESSQKAAQEAYIKAGNEIKAYREEKLRQVDSQIIKMLSEVSNRVIGKALSQAEHEELVIKALEEAKKQNVF